MKTILILLTLLISFPICSQQASIVGRVYEDINNDPIPFAKVQVTGSSTGTTTDLDGNFELKQLTPGYYNLTISAVGFKPATITEINVNNVKSTELNIALTSNEKTLKKVEISTNQFTLNRESPVSLRSISSTEVMRNPGGNRDISKVIQSFPGVGSTVAFRNDIIVRGGAPNENRFYLDGIEVPNINHFATQGSSGGPVGMINVNFINEVNLYTGAFPANRGNSLSSVMEFTQKEGNKEKLTSSLTLGSSDIGITLDGPISNKTTFIFSARRSYLQYLFKALGLPFLPTYNDFQWKTTTQINENNKLTFLGLAAIDDFELNQSVNDNITDPETIERNEYILGYLPVNTQWNYTTGLKWTHFGEKGFQNIVFSRNTLQNNSVKYQNNDETNNELLNYTSTETENKFRFEHVVKTRGWKLKGGTGIESASYYNSTSQQLAIGDSVTTINYQSDLDFIKFAFFGNANKSFFNNRVSVSLGVRTDFNNYSDQMNNPIDQLSPRLSLSYALNENWSLNSNIGRYYQLPAYTILGFRNNEGALVNKENEIQFIEADHLVAGLEYRPGKFAKISVEGFYKKYNNYPFLINEGISLANLGGDFGVIGNSPANSSSQGRSYGVEFFAQQKMKKDFYGILAYTLVRSEFQNEIGNYVPSAWDARHILTITAGKKFKKNWEAGLKFRYSGGAPYTPYDLYTSSLIPVWNSTQRGVLDYSLLNTERLPAAHGLDIRIDKKWYFQKSSLNFYVDIQNVYNFQSQLQPYFTVVKDTQGNPVVNSNNPSTYDWKYIDNISGTVLPSVGVQFDF